VSHEEAVVKAFILPVRQERYLEFLRSPKKRSKFIEQLAHFKHLNPEFIVGIPSNQRNAAGLLSLLMGKGASAKCWVISENSELDGKEIDLQTALKETVGRQMGTFISCIPGKLAYFEDEDGRYILERKS
jgi:hypothetical protein